MRRGSLVESRDSAGPPATVGDTKFTPLVRSVIVRWPGGGAVWSGPAAIIVERAGTPDRVPIVNVNRRIVWGLRASAVALIATWIAHNRRRKGQSG